MDAETAFTVFENADKRADRLETLGEDVTERPPVIEYEVGGTSIADNYEQRLIIYFEPPDRGDGTPAWDVPPQLVAWGDSNGLVLRRTIAMPKAELMSASFALREGTPHNPRAIVREEFGALLGAGLTAAEALDYWACDIAGQSQTDWAGSRGVGKQTVNDRVTDARDALRCAECGDAVRAHVRDDENTILCFDCAGVDRNDVL